VSVVATGIGAVADLAGFKNMDIANLHNIKNTNTAKMFEGLNADGAGGPASQTIMAAEQKGMGDDYRDHSTVYDEETRYSENNSTDMKSNRKSGSFFDMFKAKSQHQPPQKQSTQHQPPQQRQQQPIMQDSAQEPFTVNRNKKSAHTQEQDYQPPSQQQAAVNSENDYDMPSCFRRKK
jgi:hypothetical protein